VLELSPGTAVVLLSVVGAAGAVGWLVDVVS
jgi:hypothetical protein